MYNLKLIKSIAASKNISLKFIADNVGITPTGLSKIIRTNSTSMDTLTKIANILDVPVQTFIVDSEHPSLSGDITINNANGTNNAVGGSSVSSGLEELAVLRAENKILKEHNERLYKQIEKLEAQNEKLLNAITK